MSDKPKKRTAAPRQDVTAVVLKMVDDDSLADVLGPDRNFNAVVTALLETHPLFLEYKNTVMQRTIQNLAA